MGLYCIFCFIVYFVNLIIIIFFNRLKYMLIIFFNSFIVFHDYAMIYLTYSSLRERTLFVSELLKSLWCLCGCRINQTMTKVSEFHELLCFLIYSILDSYIFLSFLAGGYFVVTSLCDIGEGVWNILRSSLCICASVSLLWKGWPGKKSRWAYAHVYFLTLTHLMWPPMERKTSQLLQPNHSSLSMGHFL